MKYPKRHSKISVFICDGCAFVIGRVSGGEFYSERSYLVKKGHKSIMYKYKYIEPSHTQVHNMLLHGKIFRLKGKEKISFLRKYRPPTG